MAETLGPDAQVTNSTFTMGSRPCPKCKSQAFYRDHATDAQGRVYTLRDAVALLQRPGMDRHALAGIAERLRVAREHREPGQDVAAGVAAVSPELGDVLRRLFVPQNAGEMYAMISMLLAIIAIIQSQRGRSPSITINYYAAPQLPDGPRADREVRGVHREVEGARRRVPRRRGGR